MQPYCWAQCYSTRLSHGHGREHTSVAKRWMVGVRIAPTHRVCCCSRLELEGYINNNKVTQIVAGVKESSRYWQEVVLKGNRLLRFCWLRFSFASLFSGEEAFFRRIFLLLKLFLLGLDLCLIGLLHLLNPAVCHFN